MHCDCLWQIVRKVIEYSSIDRQRRSFIRSVICEAEQRCCCESSDQPTARDLIHSSEAVSQSSVVVAIDRRAVVRLNLGLLVVVQ